MADRGWLCGCRGFYDIFLGCALVLSSVLQYVLTTTARTVFGDTSYLVMPSVQLLLLVLYGGPVLYVRRYMGGYLPEVHGWVVRKSFRFVGLCASVAGVMEFVAFTRTPVTLQASLGHLVIPFTVAFTVASNPEFFCIYSRTALIGCLLVIAGAILHMSLFFLCTPANIEVIFCNTIFLLAQIPTTWGLVTQQQLYSTRRINVFHFLFKAGTTQLICFILFIPLNSITGLASFRLQNITVVIRDFFGCLFNMEGTSHGLHKLCPLSPIVLALLVLATFASQLSQLFLVRRVLYEPTAVTILSIPTALFITDRLIMSFDIFGTTVSPLLRSKIPRPDLSLELLPHLFVLLGAVVYRLDAGNALERDYLLRAEIFVQSSQYTLLDEPEHNLPLGKLARRGTGGRSSLDVARKTHANAGTHTSHTSTHTSHTGTHTSHTGTHTTHTGTHTSHTGTHTSHTGTHTSHTRKHSGHTGKDTGQAGAHTSHTGKHTSHTGKDTGHTGKDTGHTGTHSSTHSGHTGTHSSAAHGGLHRRGASRKANELEVKISGLLGQESENLGQGEERVERGDSPTAQGTPREMSRHPALMTIPFPRGNENQHPPILRPVIMNVWSGSIPCEYTDYKRYLDLPAGLRDPVGDQPVRFLPKGISFALVKQYTVNYMSTLRNKEEFIRKVYAFLTLGSVASPAVEHFDDSSPSSTSALLADVTR